jgi:hypothetical protein
MAHPKDLPKVEGAHHTTASEELPANKAHNRIIIASSKRRIWMGYYRTSYIPLASTIRLLQLKGQIETAL